MINFSARVKEVSEKTLWYIYIVINKLNFFDIISIFIMILTLCIYVFVDIPLKKYFKEQDLVVKNLSLKYKNLNELNAKLYGDKIEEKKANDSNLFRFLPLRKESKNQIFKIQKTFVKNKLNMESINYQYADLDKLSIYHVKIEGKFNGAYNSQRQLIYDLLSDNLNLSITKIDMANGKNFSGSLHIELNLYYRSLKGDKEI